ncbi:MAG: hypothetical protein ACI4Q3_01235, partial [Kiritimatiellia bacterium]
ALIAELPSNRKELHALALPSAVDGVVTLEVAEGVVVTYDSALPETATKLVKTGRGEAELTVASTATCPVEVQEGTLTPTRVDALGSPESSAGAITVSDGATLKFGFTGTSQGTIMMKREVHIAGAGVDGKGAVLLGGSSGGSALSDSLLQKLVLDADATIGAPNRWGVREIVFDGHVLTRVGGNNFMLYCTNVRPGHFVNAEGTLTLQNTSFTGSAADSSLTLAKGALSFWNIANPLPVTLNLNGGGFDGGAGTPSRTAMNNRISGAIVMNADTRSVAKLLNIDCPVLLTNASSKTFYVGNNGSTMSVVNFREHARVTGLRLALNDLALVNVFGGVVTADMTRVANGGPNRSAMRQTDGLWANGEWDVLHVGETAGSYGAYLLEGGCLDVMGNHGNDAAYIGKSANDTRRSVGMLVQKGGLYRHSGTSATVNNGMALGRQGYGYCVVSGGTNDTFTTWTQVPRIRVALEGGIGVLAASGTGTVVRTAGIDMGDPGTNYTAHICVRDGAELSADRLRVFLPTNAAHAAATAGELYFDGGTLKPTYGWGFSGLDANSADADSRMPPFFTIGPGGLVIDTSACYSSSEREERTLSQMVLRLSAPTGKGLASITLPEISSSAIYMGPVPLFIEGAGHGAVAYADYDFDTKTFTPVILAPGSDYDETTKVYFPAANSLDGASGRLECTYTLADNVATGGLTKRGDMALCLYRPNTYGGPTVVEEGVLVLAQKKLLPPTTHLTVRTDATLRLVDETVGALSGQGRIAEGNLTCTGDLVLNASDTFAADATPLTFDDGKQLVFGADARVVVADPENLDAYKTAGSRVVVRAPGGIEGRPSFVQPEGASSAWHVVQSATEIKLSYLLGTTIILR